MIWFGNKTKLMNELREDMRYIAQSVITDDVRPMLVHKLKSEIIKEVFSLPSTQKFIDKINYLAEKLRLLEEKQNEVVLAISFKEIDLILESLNHHDDFFRLNCSEKYPEDYKVFKELKDRLRKIVNEDTKP